LLGLPTIQAKSEAEAQCADLVIKGFAEGVISEDIDTLVFKSDSLVKNFNRQ
jgi:flap endonuclease-1